LFVRNDLQSWIVSILINPRQVITDENSVDAVAAGNAHRRKANRKTGRQMAQALRLSGEFERDDRRFHIKSRRQNLMSNYRMIITAFALSSTLAFGLQPGWSQTSGGSSSGSGSQGLGTGSSGSGTSGSTGSSGSTSGRSGSSSARSSADCPDGSIARARDRAAAAALVQVAKAPVGAPEVQAVLDAAAAPEAALWHSPILIVLQWAAQGPAPVALEAARAVEVEPVVAWVAAVAVRDRAAWAGAAAAAQEWAAARGAAGPPVNTNGNLSVVALD
jgi:hypothetical protein